MLEDDSILQSAIIPERYGDAFDVSSFPFKALRLAIRDEIDVTISPQQHLVLHRLNIGSEGTLPKVHKNRSIVS
jgi:hypothetical protein